MIDVSTIRRLSAEQVADLSRRMADHAETMDNHAVAVAFARTSDRLDQIAAGSAFGSTLDQQDLIAITLYTRMYKAATAA